ncbi:hypothetical protein Tco_0319565 [Tanacetum coccineum]
MQNYTRYDAQSFYDAMIFNMDSLGKYMLELILHQQRTPQLLKQKKLMQTQEDHSNPIPALNVDSLKVDLVVIQNTCSEKEDSNSETASSKLVKECSLNSETKDVHAIKYKMSKAKERCMAYFRSLHSHLQVLSKEDLKGTRIEHGFKRAFMSLFGQDVDTFTSTMLLNVDQLQKQLDKDEFQEDGSMTAFWVVNNQFQKFIDSQFTLDYDSQMTDKYFVEYTRIEVKHFKDTLLQHMGNVKKSIAKRIQVQDDSSRSGNDTDADDADIRPIYDEEPMAKETSPRSDLRGKPTGRLFKSVGLRPLFDEYFNGENQVVLKSSAVTTTDASNKRQQQPDSTPSTSTLATTVSANGNFDLNKSDDISTRTGGDLPRTLPCLKIEVLSYDMVKNVYKGKMMTMIELNNMEQSQQGVSIDVLKILRFEPGNPVIGDSVNTSSSLEWARLCTLSDDRGGVPRFKGIIGVCVPRSISWQENLDRVENVSFDLVRCYLYPSFIEGSTAKGVGLRVANSDIDNHREDDFTPLETI